MGGNEDDLVGREHSRCGLPFLVATVAVAAESRSRNSRVLHLAGGGLCSVPSAARAGVTAAVVQILTTAKGRRAFINKKR